MREKDIVKILSKIRFLRFFYTLIICKLVPDRFFLKCKYRIIFNRKLDLENPVTFNEKIQWRKIYDRNPLYTLCSDKYLVREYVKDKIGEEYLVPLLLVTDRPEEINFSNLEIPFIIKLNNGCGKNIIVKDKKEVLESQTKKFCKSWLKEKYYIYSKEMHYKGIKSCIIIEKLLLDSNGGLPKDYKFHCFGGKVEFIHVVSSRSYGLRKTIFDTRWKPLPFQNSPVVGGRPLYKKEKALKKPRNLNEMLIIAGKLSEDFEYVRVDLYSIDGRIYFGELTFTPGAGFVPFVPDEFDYVYGKKWNLKNIL